MAEHYLHAKSWCYCGHLGDGPSIGDPMRRSLHGGINGHGPCNVEGCDCMQFTWKRFTNEYEENHANRKRKEQA